MNNSYKYFSAIAIIIIGLFLVHALVACTSPPSPPEGGCSGDCCGGCCAGCCGSCCGDSTTGDPVYIKKGEFVHEVTDFTIKGRRLNVEIKRRYGSRRNTVSPFGYGWDFNYNMRLQRVITAMTGGGSSGGGGGAPSYELTKIIFYNGTGCNYEYYNTSSSGSTVILKRSDSPFEYIQSNNFVIIGEVYSVGTFDLVQSNGIKYKFDSSDRLWKIEDQFSNSIVFTYNQNYSNQINYITDDLGRKIYFTYNSDGNIETIKDFADRQWEYIYDGSGDLTDVLGPETEENPDGVISGYSYVNHNLASVYDANDDEIVRNYYNEDDRIYRQDIDGATYLFNNDTANGVMTTTDREGNIIKQAYNRYGQLTSHTVYTKNPQDEPNHFTTSYYYNSEQRRKGIVYPAGNSVNYSYDSYGNISAEIYKSNASISPISTDPNVIIKNYYYDSVWKNKVRVVSGPISNIIYDYNSTTGNLEKITYPYIETNEGWRYLTKRFSYDSFGRIDTFTADGIVTKYIYHTNSDDANNYGRLWKIIQDYNTIDGLNITTTIKYDKLGRIAEINDPNGDTTKLVFNDFDKLEEIISPEPFNNIMRIGYDKNGYRAKMEREITGEPNQITRLVYDRYEKLLRMIDPLNNITQYGYNKNKDPNIITDAEENSTKYGYNERNLVMTVTDANGFVTKYRYNLNGKLAEIEDASGNITKYGYDGFDRVICITYPDETTEIFTYDKDYNVLSKKNRKGEIIEYTYNALGWMVSKKRPDEPNMVFRYDVAGRVADVNNNGNVTKYEYDRVGRVTEVNNPEHKMVKYEYDSRGLRTKLTYSDNSYVNYEYDSMSRLVKVKYNGGTIAEYGHDQLSRRALLKYVNDTNAVYQYDLGDRLTRIINNTNSDPIDIQYSLYDNVGNRKNMIANGDESAYTYDKLYQIIGVNYPAGWNIHDTNYYYDKLGSRKKTEAGSTTTEYSRNSLNQYATVASVAYSYDLNGNLTNDGTYKYYYDCENRLTDVNTIGDVRVASYKYDYLGRRTQKIVHSTQNTTRYVYDGDNLIAEYDGSWNLLRKYIYGDRIDEPICMVTSANIYYYQFDGLGSVVALTDSSGTIAEQYHYDVFGVPNIFSSVGNRFMFTGREYDNETGNYYYRARYYKPSLGKFLQADPISIPLHNVWTSQQMINSFGKYPYISPRLAANFLYRNSIGRNLRNKFGTGLLTSAPHGFYIDLNLYTYCGNNPINFIDPYGLFEWDTGDFVGAVGGGGIVGGIIGAPVGGIPGWGVGAIGGGLGYIGGWAISEGWDWLFGDPDDDDGCGSSPGSSSGDDSGGDDDWDGDGGWYW